MLLLGGPAGGVHLILSSLLALRQWREASGKEEPPHFEALFSVAET